MGRWNSVGCQIQPHVVAKELAVPVEEGHYRPPLWDELMFAVIGLPLYSTT